MEVAVIIVLAVLALGLLIVAVRAGQRAKAAQAATSAAVAERDERTVALTAAEAARADAQQQAAATATERDEAAARAAAAEKEAARADAERDEARHEADAAAQARADAEDRLAGFEQRLADAEAAQATAAESAARARASAPDITGEIDAQVLWALEKSRTERTWRHSVAVDPTASPFTDAGPALTEAIQVELDAAREEVGAEVDLDAELDGDVTAAGAVLTLRVVQELVADVVRRAESTVIRLRADGRDLVVTIDATDEDGRAIPPAVLPAPPSPLIEAAAGTIRIRNAVERP